MVQLVTIGRADRAASARSFLGLLRLGERRVPGAPGPAVPMDAQPRGRGRRGDALPRWPAVERSARVLLEPGRERDAVIRATFRQHGFPGGVIYWIFRRHIFAVGRFYRLEDVSRASTPDSATVRP